MNDLAKALADQTLSVATDSMKTTWKELPGQHKQAVREAMRDWSRLSLQALSGKDVDRELAHVNAQIKSWAFVGASQTRKAIEKAIKEAAVFAGKTLLKVVV